MIKEVVSEQNKSDSAFVLYQILKTALDKPVEVAIQFLRGLMTKLEIEELVKRNEIRLAISKELATTGRFSVQVIGERCHSSKTLVTRVWDAMCTQYAPETTTHVQSRIALPKEDRAQEIVKSILAKGGFRVDVPDKRKGTGFIIDMSDAFSSIPCSLLSGKDILLYMRAGAVDGALVGDDNIRESEAIATLTQNVPMPLTYWASFREDKDPFRMCLAVSREDRPVAEAQGIHYFNGKTVATSYPGTLREYMESHDIALGGVITLKGGVEKAMRPLGAQAILDIVETGGSLSDNDLEIVGDPLYIANMSLISRKGVQRPQTEDMMMRAFASRLTASNQCVAA